MSNCTYVNINRVDSFVFITLIYKFICPSCCVTCGISILFGNPVGTLFIDSIGKFGEATRCALVRSKFVSILEKALVSCDTHPNPRGVRFVRLSLHSKSSPESIRKFVKQSQIAVRSIRISKTPTVQYNEEGTTTQVLSSILPTTNIITTTGTTTTSRQPLQTEPRYTEEEEASPSTTNQPATSMFCCWFHQFKLLYIFIVSSFPLQIEKFMNIIA